MSGLEGKRVLVVGASAGIGRSFAIECVRRGASVVVAARRADRLDELVTEAGGGVALVADVASTADCERLAVETVAAVGPLDLVLYAAGTATLRHVPDMRADDWEQVLRTNFLGFQQMARALAPGALAPAAVVGALSSEIVGHPRHGMVGYAVSKAALEEVLRGWRLECPEVRFCTVTVGATQPTEFGDAFDADALVPILDQWIRHGQLPGTFMDTHELAALLGDLFATMLAHPGIGIEHLLVRSPAPPMTTLDELPPQ
ncbi:MAG TPA: SDR family oxidoreductase [Acidimicrobiales bacterium]|nr:SDR family oxidoreductase [Acidimicrobiales bacterium]